ncbi:MAG: glycosyltransferase [Lachnospiraceae bacterium]|nr:glycosyltransferase [Lachnospiraceae bacterium]
MKDLISIIVPVYNVEKYLAKCLDSLTGQTYRNLEILLIDDGSEDRSGSIMQEYAALDDRICCIHQKNRGSASARNEGLKAVRGNYIAFVDADDEIDREMISYLYSMMEPGVDITACGYREIDEHERVLAGEKNFPEEGIYTEEEFWKIYFNHSGAYCVVVWNKLFRREVLEGLRFPEGVCHEDEFLITDVFRRNVTVKCSPKKLYDYRIREHSLSTNMDIEGYLDRMKAFVDRMHYFAEHGIYHEMNPLFHLTLEDFYFIMEAGQDTGRLHEALKWLKKETFFLAGLPVPFFLKLKVLLFRISGQSYFFIRRIWRRCK